MQVFVVSRDGHLWNIYWDGKAWHHWVEMGGDFAAGAEVAASTWGADRIDVFVNSAGELWHRWWDGTHWVDWRREDRWRLIVGRPYTPARCASAQTRRAWSPLS